MNPTHIYYATYDPIEAITTFYQYIFDPSFLYDSKSAQNFQQHTHVLKKLFFGDHDLWLKMAAIVNSIWRANDH